MKRENIDTNFVFLVLLFISFMFLILNNMIESYREIKRQEYYKIGYCEGQGGEILNDKCIDKKYILELKN